MNCRFFTLCNLLLLLTVFSRLIDADEIVPVDFSYVFPQTTVEKEVLLDVKIKETAFVSEISKSCSCVSRVLLPEVIEPGKQIVCRIFFYTGNYLGRKDEKVKIKLVSPANQQQEVIELNILAFVSQYVNVMEVQPISLSDEPKKIIVERGQYPSDWVDLQVGNLSMLDQGNQIVKASVEVIEAGKWAINLLPDYQKHFGNFRVKGAIYFSNQGKRQDFKQNIVINARRSSAWTFYPTSFVVGILERNQPKTVSIAIKQRAELPTEEIDKLEVSSPDIFSISMPNEDGFRSLSLTAHVVNETGALFDKEQEARVILKNGDIIHFPIIMRVK
jgi:hypothetical protein